MNVGESQVGMDYRLVKIMCSLLASQILEEGV